jgi:hypothetical protein
VAEELTAESLTAVVASTRHGTASQVTVAWLIRSPIRAEAFLSDS